MIDLEINQRAQPLRNPLCVALDVDEPQEALKLAHDLADIVGGFKLGPRLLLKDSQLAPRIARLAPLFIDCKFFDIPSTMISAIRTSFDLGASLVTVHALSSHEALSELSRLEKELIQIRPFRILAVTVLTSWDQASLPQNLKSQPIPEHVYSLAQMTQKSGLSSVVCSPEDIELLKPLGLYLLTPGIRFSLENLDDQKRVLTPHEAIGKGASALVVGRPILKAKHPREAAVDYLHAIYEKKS